MHPVHAGREKSQQSRLAPPWAGPSAGFTALCKALRHQSHQVLGDGPKPVTFQEGGQAGDKTQLRRGCEQPLLSRHLNQGQSWGQRASAQHGHIWLEQASEVDMSMAGKSRVDALTPSSCPQNQLLPAKVAPAHPPKCRGKSPRNHGVQLPGPRTLEPQYSVCPDLHQQPMHLCFNAESGAGPAPRQGVDTAVSDCALQDA